jgi:hypothetical protein
VARWLALRLLWQVKDVAHAQVMDAMNSAMEVESVPEIVDLIAQMRSDIATEV